MPRRRSLSWAQPLNPDTGMDTARFELFHSRRRSLTRFTMFTSYSSTSACEQPSFHPWNHPNPAMSYPSAGLYEGNNFVRFCGLHRTKFDEYACYTSMKVRDFSRSDHVTITKSKYHHCLTMKRNNCSCMGERISNVRDAQFSIQTLWCSKLLHIREFHPGKSVKHLGSVHRLSLFATALFADDDSNTRIIRRWNHAISDDGITVRQDVAHVLQCEVVVESCGPPAAWRTKIFPQRFPSPCGFDDQYLQCTVTQTQVTIFPEGEILVLYSQRKISPLAKFVTRVRVSLCLQGYCTVDSHGKCFLLA